MERNETERIARGTNIDKMDGEPNGKEKTYEQGETARKAETKKRHVPRVERRGEGRADESTNGR